MADPRIAFIQQVIVIEHSRIFFSPLYLTLQAKIVEFLNHEPAFLSLRTANSPRAVGDAVEQILVDNFDKILGDLVKDYSAAFARRAMADLAFTDRDGFYYVVDVKTHRLDTRFNMPNLTSVERLARFYEEDSHYFVVLNVDYNIQGTRAVIEKVTFVPIEFLAWDCLTIGALGWGQIQIANSNIITILPGNSRKKWMVELCDNLFEFYPRETQKITDRLEYFRRVKQHWENKRE